MAVKAGYKQTKVGVIPEDWAIKQLNDLCEILSGGTPSTSQSSYWNGNIPWCTPTDITALSGTKYLTTTTRMITHIGLNNSSAEMIPEKSVIMTSRATIGECAINLIPVSTNQGFKCFVPKTTTDVEYLYYKLIAERKGFISLCSGSTFLEISKQQLKSYEIIIPPIYQQQAIAEALSDVDQLIASLDQLIEKRRALKTATMQQLLTGKTRLAGFSGEWEVKSIYEIADRRKDLFDDGDWIEAEHITDKGVRLIQTGNIGIGRFLDRETKKYIFQQSFISLSCKTLITGDLLISRLADPAGRACILPDLNEENLITAVDVTIFRPRPEIANRKFLMNVFSTPQWFKSISDRSGGTTHKRISRGALGRVTIALPTIEEQNAIAEVLSDMDAEITELEQRRDKTIAIKQGMMQELLTGRTRLI